MVLGVVLLISGVLFKAASLLSEVSTYPFSLGWSEASRYYYASLFFSERIYGVATPPSVLHPSRYLMQAAPFLLPGLPIWAHRLWQVLLWLVFPMAAAYLLAVRLSRFGGAQTSPPLFRILFSLWAFLFLFQGPVYYHLLVAVILVLYGYEGQRPWRSLFFILMASAWAGISRINWLPVPALLASAFYFLETPVRDKPVWRYLLPPFAWGIAGSGLGFAAQKAYETLSGNPPDQFGSSFTSDLLWYRLFPSATYSLGVIPAAVLVSLPVLLVLGSFLWSRWRRYSWVRLAGLAAILFVLFSGGIVVSVKIGGGSNLHNLDAYLVLLLVIGCSITFGGIASERKPLERKHPSNWALISPAMLLPVLFVFGTSGISPARDQAAAQAALERLRAATQQAVEQGGEVLFISERHLLTFHTLENVPLAPEYENVFLMEMAMANNASYLNAFYEDLRSHRFALIVSYPIHLHYQGRAHQFGEENDAWVDRVARPILCSYEPQIDLPEVTLQVLAPRDGDADCP